MTRIGILSMQQIPNYGSFLQAYGLKKLLESFTDVSCSFIDIRPGVPLVSIENNSNQSFLARLPRIIMRLIKDGPFFIRDEKRKSTSYFKAFENYQYLLPRANDDELFDVAIIGSDEVFNCCQPSWWGFSTQLFGDIKNAKTIATYAGSFGHTTIEDINKYGIRDEIISALKNVTYYSVRDKNSANIIENINGVTPKIHIDPVLAYGYKTELSGFDEPPMSDYIIVYSYGHRITDNNEINAIKKYAKETNKELVAIMGYYPWCDKLVSPSSPIEVLRWFKYADAVITDTFHGTIFSAIAHRPFATFIRPSNRNKLKDLLSVLGLDSREIVDCSKLSSIMRQPVDFYQMETRLESFRVAAHNYLNSILSRND
ncbi:polysaccharide pyruvyl transferase family protein [uncultured Muribaculum sp.]|uniref:polysaccharide pyruvyl transferase family protein n=1 Tax=uncultured Muribaculum sp. TaxID=1918613 RepID=UPI002638B422|nr:polysaccharide pyruvyl transferase family protein [uncultured Muribaculum sp.]